MTFNALKIASIGLICAAAATLISPAFGEVVKEYHNLTAPEGYTATTKDPRFMTEDKQAVILDTRGQTIKEGGRVYVTHPYEVRRWDADKGNLDIRSVDEDNAAPVTDTKVGD